MDLHARLADLYQELASTHRRLAKDVGDDYVDQHNSPLGSRLHCRLVRNGSLPGYRAGRRILVRRVDLDTYLEQHRIVPTVPRGGDEEDALIQRMLAKAGGRAA